MVQGAIQMAITPRQLDIKGAYIQDAYAALESEIMKMLIKSLKTKIIRRYQKIKR